MSTLMTLSLGMSISLVGCDQSALGSIIGSGSCICLSCKNVDVFVGCPAEGLLVVLDVVFAKDVEGQLLG